MKEYFVYIMANWSKTLCTGVTNDLERRRMFSHKKSEIIGFTSRYNIKKLVYFESGFDIHEAISPEKEIKGWLRIKKTVLIESMIPQWKDLSDSWYSWIAE